MDYKKEYDEMVRRVKELHETGNALTKKQMEIICPALAESEDERIRKHLIAIVELYWGKTNDPDKAKDLAYLEKRKEQKPSAEEILAKAGLKPYKDGNKWCILAGDNIQEGICGFGDTIDEALYQFLMEVLEKQKENPKSADSIPSKCASDAKFESRWHEVADSLPDNGREVLAKDKFGNTLLARYDGEGWDVSVYDDEDYRCHNGISKWREIPSEKQNEQKPSGKISVSEELYEHIRNTCACIDDAMSSDTMCDMIDYLEMANSSAQKAFDMVDESVVK